MFINFFLYSFFIFLISIIGNSFNNFILNKFNIKILNNNFFFNLLSSLFFLGVISFFFNFIFPINSFFFYSILFIIFIWSLKSISIDIFLDLKKNIILIFVVSVITLKMKPGYDAGLYHIPFQTWIRDYKIIFGMFNIHERFAHHSIYNYIGAILWFKNNFNLLNYLQGTFILTFIIFLKNLLNSNKLINFGFVLSTLLSLPIWIRYFELGYGLVDLPFGLFFFMTFIIGLNFILKDKKNENNTKKNYFYFCLLAIFLFFLKPSGILILPFFLYVSLFIFKKKLISSKSLFKILIFFFLILLLWVLKNLIIFGCIFYGLKFTCFNFQWSNIALIEQSIGDVSYYKRHFESINFKNFYLFNNSNLIYISLIFLYIFFLYYFIKKNLFNKKYLLYIFLIFSLVVNFVAYDFSSLKGTTSLISDFPEVSKNIIFKEIIKLNIILFNSATVTFLVLHNFNNKFYLDLNLNKIFLFFYISFVLIIWFSKSPDPRFAFGFFSVIPSILLFTLANKNFENIKIDKIKLQFGNLLFYGLLFIYFIFQPLKTLNNFNFELNKIEDVNYIKRDGFGVKPIILIPHQGNFCWNLKDCYFNHKDISFKKFFLNYNIATN